MAVQVQKLDAKNLLERSRMINNSKPAQDSYQIRTMLDLLQQ